MSRELNAVVLENLRKSTWAGRFLGGRFLGGHPKAERNEFASGNRNFGVRKRAWTDVAINTVQPFSVITIHDDKNMS